MLYTYIYILNILKYLLRRQGQKHQGCLSYGTDEATRWGLQTDDVNCFENKIKVISCWYDPCYAYIEV